MFSLLQGAVPPSPPAGSCSEYGLTYWVRVGQAGANMSEASGQPPSAWEEGPKCPRCPGAAHPGDLAEKQASWQVLERQARPSEFSGLICPSQTRTRRSGDSRNDLPKVTAQILGTGGISPGTHHQAASSRVPGSSSVWSGKEAPLRGCMGHVVRGWVDVERGGQPRALASPGKLLSPSLWERAAGGPQPRSLAQNPRKRELRPSPPWLMLSAWAAAQLVGFLAPLLTKLRRRPAGGQPATGRPGEGFREKREKGNRPLALFSVNSLTRGDPLQGPPGLVHSSHQDQQTWMCTHTCTHTHTHTQQPHTRTRTSLLTFRPSVENTACVNSVKRSAQQELGRMSLCREAGPLGFFSIFPPIPHFRS